MENRRVVKIAEVEAITGLERTTITRKAKDGSFPRQAGYVNEHRVWWADEVAAWLTLQLARSPEERRNSKKRPPSSRPSQQ